MDDNENKMTPEELADEALGQVVGGTFDEGMFSTNPRCCECGRDHIPLGGGFYFDPAGYVESVSSICEDCLKTYYGPEWEWHKH